MLLKSQFLINVFPFYDSFKPFNDNSLEPLMDLIKDRLISDVLISNDFLVYECIQNSVSWFFNKIDPTHINYFI